VISVVLCCAVLAAVAMDAFVSNGTAQAHAARAKLDQELSRAQSLGIPDAMLAPVTTQERHVASGEGGLFYDYGGAATHYQQLYTQLTGIEQGAPAVLQQQAQANLQAYAAALAQRKADGFQEVPAFQTRYDALQQQLAQAKSIGDLARVSALAQDGAQALTAMGTTYAQLQTVQNLLQSMQAAGVASDVAQQYITQDQQLFRAAATEADFEALSATIDAQLTQLVVTNAAAQPFLAASYIQQLQAHVAELRQYGDATNADSFQQQHDADAKQLAAATTPSEFAAIAATLSQHETSAALLAAKDKATQDFATLQQLVNSAAHKTVIDPANHRAYPAAYEYTDRNVGIGDAAQKLNAAKTVQQYQSADFEITSLTACLKAMLANMSDSTPHNQAHQTDLQLLQYFNVTSGRVVIISLREQTARFYQDGQLVNWSYVTTGAPGLPSVPGWHVAGLRLSPTTFHSPDPVGSPNYYQPTHINYAVGYNDGGYFLHDAWWRSWFGPNSNLPHYDPAAFNGGSHGCINFPLHSWQGGAAMQWVYNWTLAGTPIILY
jgi:hypothetical protein